MVIRAVRVVREDRTDRVFRAVRAVRTDRAIRAVRAVRVVRALRVVKAVRVKALYKESREEYFFQSCLDSPKRNISGLGSFEAFLNLFGKKERRKKEFLSIRVVGFAASKNIISRESIDRRRFSSFPRCG